MVNIPHWPEIPIFQMSKKVNLDLTIELLAGLGNPQNKLPPVIHIAGTNGKGSSLAMLRGIFTKAGYKTHSYTSPHITEFNERIKLADTKITDAHLHSILERVRVVADELNLKPSFFEGVTAAAFLAFSESKADVLLLETGLGGLLDCTNVVKKPILTLITPISHDHMDYLGEDIIQIAAQKAGIIKQGVPCVIGAQSERVYELLIEKCSELDAPSFCYEYDYNASKTQKGFRYLSKKFNLDLPPPALRGDHQIINAAAVIASIMLLNDKFNITTQQIKQGLKTTDWPGRLQLVEKKISKKLAGNNNIEIYLDGAHNEAGAACLAHWARENLEGNIYLVLGMTRNRNATEFCNHFTGLADKIATTGVVSEPSSYSADILAEKVEKSGIECIAADDLHSAIQELTKQAGGKKATIIVTGSLFLISDFLNLETS